MAKKVLTDNLSEPLNGATTARVDIHAGDGNLTIDRLTGGEQVLASGTLQYLENQGLPTRTLVSNNGQATLTLRGSQDVRPRFRLPWAACNGATEWQIHLNPAVSSDITAHSNGGNVKLNMDGMIITRISADTGGGNIDIVLPGNAANISVHAKTGAGNAAVSIPSGVAARIHATTGLGKTIVDPQFSQIDKNTYQSAGFDTTANKVDITLHSGAGNVSVNTRRKP
jgi:predicted membrane protein